MCYRLPLQRIIIHQTSPYWRTFATVIPSKNASADKKAPKPDPKKGKNSEEGSKKPSSRKVSIIGVGHTGSACAASLIHRKLATEVCLIDQDEKKVKGEKMDLRQIATYFNNVKVYGGTDFKQTANSKIIIIAAAAPHGKKDKEPSKDGKTLKDGKTSKGSAEPKALKDPKDLKDAKKKDPKKSKDSKDSDDEKSTKSMERTKGTKSDESKMQKDAPPVCPSFGKTSICGDSSKDSKDEKRGRNAKSLKSGKDKKSSDGRKEYLKKTAEIHKDIVKKVMEHNKNAIIIVAHPEAKLAYETWKESKLPKNRVIGTGTMIDTAQFRTLLSKKLCVPQSEIVGWILGDHGKKSVAIWSSVGIKGIKARDLDPEVGKGDDWQKIHKDASGGQKQIASYKGHTCWGTANCVAELVSDIFNNTGRIRPVAVSASEYLNRDKDVFMSLPCVINRNGVKNILQVKLDPEEEKALCTMAEKITSGSKDNNKSAKSNDSGKAGTKVC